MRKKQTSLCHFSIFPRTKVFSEFPPANDFQRTARRLLKKRTNKNIQPNIQHREFQRKYEHIFSKFPPSGLPIFPPSDDLQETSRHIFPKNFKKYPSYYIKFSSFSQFERCQKWQILHLQLTMKPIGVMASAKNFDTINQQTCQGNNLPKFRAIQTNFLVSSSSSASRQVYLRAKSCRKGYGYETYRSPINLATVAVSTVICDD